MKRIIVVGNGMVGYKFCEKMIAKAPAGSYHITVLGEEPRPAYDRVHLTSYINGTTAEALTMASLSWYKEAGIDLHLGDPVLKIDRAAKTVVTQSGLQIPYDILIMATGSAAMVPPIHGVEKKGVFVYRTIDDLDKIMAYAKGVKKAAVLGGGLLGLEAAKAMVDIGIDRTYVIEFAPKLMPRQLDDAGGAVLRSKLSALGLKVHTRKHTYQVLGKEQITGIQFVDESELSVDMLVISTGINARDELAKDAGLPTGPRGGIVVDDYMRTEDPAIYAIGECAAHNGMIYGLVAPGYDMAEVACTHIIADPLQGAKNERTFTGFDMSTKLKLIGVDVASFGDPFLTADKAQHVIYEDKVNGVYKRLNVSLDGKYLLGGVMVGEASQYNNLLQYYKNSMPLPGALDSLVFAATEGDKPQGAGISALPDGALICSCEGVTKAAICQAVKDGNESIDDIKACTKAGTGCGGCVPMLKDLAAMTLKTMGKEVRKDICEHFTYSRQQLYDLIKLEGLSSFEEVLEKHGTGDGCEVCKPVISSILASTFNEMILRKNNDTAQDSNDRFLANIQKGGSYSVVPRIAGGEITPDKLLVIATVAKKYNLYTKITGGQRIDMFGAHLSDLPLIWKELIDAGFESGHAYGKSLRTVKSCVGSTWCRFGLHDSVSFAIQIENRYKGLRTPHKIKSAVSGCIRECAEAQSKDFGIIATEKGWNLYVCGNGGSKPQHALLLAQDLDSETCIRYIDRFLMYYIKTADPLTRTATWLNKLEGGIDYLKKVVIEDCLGKCHEWETEMQQVLSHYECEWKAAIEDPSIRKRFAHFVNAPDQKDPTMEFVEMRTQKRVAEWQ
ncbi:nitrite reductase large subunit NirB [Arachidicoccus ginsenosidivorans]|uniref:Nitrite reductase large subunit n=1 Tax=Arachidicoccus ginsenosidivorans TaxID=496057 RepID=A0A5B8VMU1_9BACT|nr:nitrite reductase large subunit NirB [Arachidicoccus ginsenosidivorans]QEC72904.1 nitrite reductase large subunit [Arachidicoccus ginsenosidivorans]